MERGSKRKAAVAANSPVADNRAIKRQKTPDSYRATSTGETPESTTEAGLKFVDHLKNIKDSHGRNYTEDFLLLPNKRIYPDYFEQIALPIAIDTIEAKLHRNGYPTLATLESDVKRMVANAKLYNEKTSAIFQDAERIRKMLSNYMKKVNPAYNDPQYVAVATPIPERDVDAPTLDDGAHQKGKPNGLTPAAKIVSAARPDDIATKKQTEADETNEFFGKTFQEAQDYIVDELIAYKENDLRIYDPFINLPSRALTDYYSLIKQPTSLKSVQKKVRGVRGREAPTGRTDLKSWEAFEVDMSKIWTNAREYNEDGSDMFNLASELEGHFQELLDAAKAVVEEPAQPTLKLKMAAAPPSIKLRLGSQKDSPVPPTSASPAPASGGGGFSIDQAALERQRQLVQAGTNGASQGRPSSSRSGSHDTLSKQTVSLPPGASVGRASSAAASTPPLSAGGVKSERQSSQPPVMTNGVSQVSMTLHGGQPPTGMMPPPSAAQYSSGSNHPHLTHMPNQYVVQHQQPDTRWRPEGKDASAALYANVIIASPRSIQHRNLVRQVILPHPRLTHQSITLNLPASQHMLLITPTIRQPVFDSGLYRLFVSVNGQKVGATNHLANGGDPRKPVHEARLLPGVNRIEIEMVAEPLKEEQEAAANAGRGLDVEKLSLFAQVMRN